MAFKKKKEKEPDIIVSLEYTNGIDLETGELKDYRGVLNYSKRKEAVYEEKNFTRANFQSTIEAKDKQQVEEYFSEVQEMNQVNFQQFIHYTDRTQATKLETEENETPLFSTHTTNLTKSEVENLSEKIQTAQKNGSLMWEGAVSFSVDFLARSGLIEMDEKLEEKIKHARGKEEVKNLCRQRQVNQQAIKQAIMKEMDSFLKKEGMSEDVFWWGAIHFNTKHVHAHINFLEETPKRPRVYNRKVERWEPKGNLSVQNMHTLKSRVYHALLDKREQAFHLEKEKLVGALQTEFLVQALLNVEKNFSNEKQDVKNFEGHCLKQVIQHFPENRKMIRYGSHAKDFALSKKYLNLYLDSYFTHDGKALYQEVKNAVREQLMSYQGSYAKTNEELERKIDKRLNDFRERFGNRVLRFLKEIDEVKSTKKEFLNQISTLNSEELEIFVDTFKHSSIDKGKLGLYRFALKRAFVQEERENIQIKLSEMEKLTLSIEDISFVEFQKKNFLEKLTWCNLEEKANYELATAEKKQKQEFNLRFLSPKDLPVQKASEELIEQRLSLLQEEKQFLKECQNLKLLNVLYGEISKENILARMNVEEKILETKGKIFLNNFQMNEVSEVEREQLKKENGLLFQELKTFYKRLSGSSKELKGKEKTKISRVREEDFKRLSLEKDEQVVENEQRISTHQLASRLSTFLKADNRKEMNAFMKKVRADEAAEHEEIMEEYYSQNYGR